MINNVLAFLDAKRRQGELALEITKGLLSESESYTPVLEQTREYCALIRQAYSPMSETVDPALSEAAGRAVAAIARERNRRLAPAARECVRDVETIEGILAQVGDHQPTEYHRTQIAEAVFRTTAWY